ncbi:hypothetical protein [uncultured Shewanella sp.]|uniref:hypothetical protein n=1 Tax=uncultured Shewanella sp. TaxID=173975 RepID=UPI002636B77E|nr:hypothetical protein [uncultured Shewanella sp.]
MSGKVVQLHQLMEHEALSIETDFTHLKDNELKAYLATGESLSSLKTALTRGKKLLLVDKPRAPMFIMDFPKAELSTEDRVKIILHSLKPMQVRQVHSAINPAYPKDVIKAIDNRLGTAGGMINIGGNPYQSPSSDNLHPPAEMPKRTQEPVINDPPPKQTGPDKFAKFNMPAYGKKVFAKSMVLGKHVSDMRTEEESAKNFGILSLFKPDANAANNRKPLNQNNENKVVSLAKRGDTQESDRGEWSFSGKAASRFNPYTQLLAVWAKETGGAQYEDFDFPVMVEATTRVRFYYQLPTEQELKNDSTLDKNKPILKAVHTDERQMYPDRVKVIQAVMAGDGIRAELTDELSFHWQPTGEAIVDAESDPQQETNTLNNNSTLDPANALDKQTNDALWDLKVQPQTELDTNNIVEPNVEAIVNFPSELKLKPVYLALHTGEDDEMDLKWLKVPYGQLTFDSEGNDVTDHHLFTRTPHIPHNSKGIVFDNSGITIGRGLDLGKRTASEIESLFNQAAIHAKPISPALLTWLKGAANKRRQVGYEYWKTLDANVPKAEQEITRKMQHHLFNVVYANYMTDTKRITIKQSVCDAYLNGKKIDWDALPQNVREILIDLTYRGDYTGIDDPRGNTRKVVLPAVYQDQISGNTGSDSKFVAALEQSFWKESFKVDNNRFDRRIRHLL